MNKFMIALLAGSSVAIVSAAGAANTAHADYSLVSVSEAVYRCNDVRNNADNHLNVTILKNVDGSESARVTALTFAGARDLETVQGSYCLKNRRVSFSIKASIFRW